jgi:hypothetical protein
MRVMATGAGHLAFPVRHVRRALQLCPTHLVTLEAELRLSLFQTTDIGQWRVELGLMGQRRIQFLMSRMAIDTRHGPGFMRAAPPQQLVAAGVALEAGCIFLSYCVLGIAGEANWNGVFPASGFDVGLARAMAGFASVSFLRSSRMRHGFAHGCVIEAAALVLVTAKASVAAHVVVIRLGRRVLRFSGIRD